MKQSIRFTIIMTVLASLSACSGSSQLFWEVDDHSGSTKKSAIKKAPNNSRPPLDVPPSLRGEVEVPSAHLIATRQETPAIAATIKKKVTGDAVALDARLYSQSPAEVISAVVDAMTSLNMPVQAVDSPSGTITTDWIRQETFNPAAAFGGVQAVRYRYVVRILRQKSDSKLEKTRLEIRTIGQVFVSRKWQTRPLQRKVADELFAATEERLSHS